FIKRVKAHTPLIDKTEIKNTKILMQLHDPIPTSFSPFLIDYRKKNICFPRYRDQFIPISEVMIHYLLLYNLSMLSRYESQWWGELITLKPDIEYSIIAHFLKTTSDKIPFLLGEMLLQDVHHY
ncbi:MAG TPA: YaaC family protein, partial [Bacillota bacterium]|nr:YaaC family protein [Bacillota bacterium]